MLIVLAPRARPPRSAAQAEPAKALQSTPPWLAKCRSSEATTASRSDGAIRSSGTQGRRRTAKSIRTVCSSRPSRPRARPRWRASRGGSVRSRQVGRASPGGEALEGEQGDEQAQDWAAAEPARLILPAREARGEGDHPKGGGGVAGTGLRQPSYPSTMLRMVPLPILRWGGFTGSRLDHQRPVRQGRVDLGRVHRLDPGRRQLEAAGAVDAQGIFDRRPALGQPVEIAAPGYRCRARYSSASRRRRSPGRRAGRTGRRRR
jgi:hypothetical protein